MSLDEPGWCFTEDQVHIGDLGWCLDELGWCFTEDQVFIDELG